MSKKDYNEDRLNAIMAFRRLTEGLQTEKDVRHQAQILARKLAEVDLRQQDGKRAQMAQLASGFVSQLPVALEAEIMAALPTPLRLAFEETGVSVWFVYRMVRGAIEWANGERLSRPK